MGFQSLDRAKRSSSRGSVLEVDCVEPDHLYFARVRGERVHEVQLEFANGKWAVKCSCPVGARCKHIAAAMLALEERESESDNSEPPVWDRKRIAALALAKGPGGRVKLPPSPLLDKVVAHLGRDLRPHEAAFTMEPRNKHRTRKKSGGLKKSAVGKHSAGKPSHLPNIEELIEVGQITVGVLPKLWCIAATADDENNNLAMLVRREGETLAELLVRLDLAIAKARTEDIFTDEINTPHS